MKIKNYISLNRYIFCFLLYSATAQSFSTSPENSENYSPANWQESTSAENDAKNAIVNNDNRLLGFAGRGYTIPGVDSSLAENYSEKCGVRLFEEFSDVIRNREQAEQMSKASEYAIEYNKIILSNCTLSD